MITKKSIIQALARSLIFIFCCVISLVVTYLMLYFFYNDAGRRIEPRILFIAPLMIYFITISSIYLAKEAVILRIRKSLLVTLLVAPTATFIYLLIVVIFSIINYGRLP